MIAHGLKRRGAQTQTGGQDARLRAGSLPLPPTISILVVLVRLLPASIDQTFS